MYLGIPTGFSLNQILVSNDEYVDHGHRLNRDYSGDISWGIIFFPLIPVWPGIYLGTCASIAFDRVVFSKRWNENNSLSKRTR